MVTIEGKGDFCGAEKSDIHIVEKILEINGIEEILVQSNDDE